MAMKLGYPSQESTNGPLARLYASAIFAYDASSTRTDTIDAPFTRACRIAVLGNRDKDGYLRSLEHAVSKPAATCDRDPGQHSLIWPRNARCLAMAALSPFRHTASSLVYVLQAMLSQLLQKVLFKAFAHTKEKLIGAPRLGVCILDRFKLECADIVSNLREAITLRRGIAIDNRLLGQRELHSIVQRFRDQRLTVVVINLHLIELLQILEMIQQVNGEISSNALDSAPRSEQVDIQLGFLVCKHRIREREILQEDAERREIPLALLHVHTPISIVAVEQRREMEGNVPQPLCPQRLEIIGFIPLEPITLIMKYKGDEIVLGLGAGVAGFINEYGKILHSPHAPYNKNAGGKPPAVGGPPCGEDHLIYTTCRFVHSIISNFEHMFSIIETNTRSTYRKAA